jgi:DNA-binding SARP family transcriptional activator
MDKIMVDIRQFNSLNERAAKSIDSNQVSEAIGLLKESIKLYRGNLLEGESLGPLLSIESASVEKTIFGSFVALGKLLLQTGEYEEALSILSKATAISFADENLYRLLMLVYYALCNPGQALQIYNKLEKYFAAEFQTSPHRKTRELRDLIREGTDQSISYLIRWLSREDQSKE